MSESRFAENFRDLIVYQETRAVAREIFNLSKRFPKEETYSLTDQVRRSSRSIGAQIAEAWGKRRYTKHFTSKLSDADSEQLETQHWIESATDCEYVSPTEADELIGKLTLIGKRLNSMIRKADQFHPGDSRALKEDRAEYFAHSRC